MLYNEIDMAYKRTKAQIEADKLRTGRRPKTKAEKMSKHILVSMTPAEWKRVKAEAKKQGLSVSALLMKPYRKEK